MGKPHPKWQDARKSLREPLIVCCLYEGEANALEHHGLNVVCGNRRHPHYKRKHADKLVAEGQAIWVGKFKRVIRWQRGYSIMKVYRREGLCALLDGPGEPTMQLVRGGSIR